MLQASCVVLCLFALRSRKWILVCPRSLGCLLQFIDSRVVVDCVRCVTAGI